MFLARKTGHGGLAGLEPPQVEYFCPKLKINMEITYFEHFSFYAKKILLVIFGTLFSKNCQFFEVFGQSQILVQ